MDRDSIRSLGEAYQQIKEQGNTKKTKTTAGQVAGGVDRMLLRNLKRYVDNAVKAGRGIYDKSKEAGDAAIQGVADFTSDRITGGNTGDTIIRNRQKEAERVRKELGVDGSTGTLAKPGASTNSVLGASNLPTIPGVSRGEETPEQRAARRARVGLTGNGEGGSETGITSDVAAKQNAADAAAGRSTVRDTTTGEPTNVQQPSDTPAATTPEKKETTPGEGGGGSLTPMQQWAKNFPKLAAKVKPGQVGYDDIQAMNSPQSQAGSSVTQTKVGDMNKATNNVQTSFNNNKATSIKPTGPISVKSPKLDMNKAKNNTTTAFRGIPEEAQQDLLNFILTNGMCDTADQAQVIAEHMTDEYRMHILMQEGWEQAVGDTIKKAAQTVGSTAKAGWDGLRGKKTRADNNPVARGLNALGRTSYNSGRKLGAAMTGAATPATKNEPAKPKPQPKRETKNDSPSTPKAEPKSTPTNSSTPSSSTPSNSGNKGESGGRLDKALKWASDPKNKDAWMKKESLDGFMEDLLGENRLTPEALEAAAAANLKRDKEKYGHKVHGTDAMKDVIDRVTRKKKGQV